MIDVPGPDDGPRRYCTTPECETTWRPTPRCPACPVCDGEGVVSHQRPAWWPALTDSDIARRRRAAT